MIVATLVLAAAIAAASEDTLARVDGTEIKADAFARRAEAIRADGGRATPDQIIDALVDEVLLAAEARRLGLATSPAVATHVAASLRRLAAEAFMAKQVTAKFEPEEAALREMFHSTADFVVYESLVYESVSAAEAGLQRIRAGATLAAEAKNAVTAQLHPNPAAAPALLRAQVDPALAAALFEAAPGTLVGPVQLGTGAAIARLLEKGVGTEAQYQGRRPALAARAKSQFTATKRKQFTKHLRENAKVTLDEKFLLGLQGTSATPAQLEHVIAVVNGSPFRYREIHGTVRMLGGASGHLAGGSLKIELAWKAIEARLLEDLAVERGYDKSPEVIALRPEAERAALAVEAVEQIRRATPAPSKMEIEAFHKRNLQAYRGRPLKDVREDVAARATEEKRQVAIAARVAALRSSAAISIDRAAVARTGQTG